MQTFTEITEENLAQLRPSDTNYFTYLNMESLEPGMVNPILNRDQDQDRYPHKWEGVQRRLRARLRAIKAFNLPFRLEYQAAGNTPHVIGGNTIYMRANGILSGAQNNSQRRQLRETINKRRRTLTETQAALDRELQTLLAMPREKRTIIGYDLLRRIMDDVKTWPHVLEASWGGRMDHAAPNVDLAPNEAAIRFVPVMFKNPNNTAQWMLTSPMLFRMPQSQDFVPKSVDGMGHPHTYRGSGDLCWGQGAFNNNLHNNVEQLARWVIGLNERSIAEPSWFTLAHNWWRANADRYFELNPNPVYVKGNPNTTARDAETLPLTRDLVDDVLAAQGQWVRGVRNRELVAALTSGNFRLVERLTTASCAQCGASTRRVIRYGTHTASICEHCFAPHTERWNIFGNADDMERNSTMHTTPIRPGSGYTCSWDSTTHPAHTNAPTLTHGRNAEAVVVIEIRTATGRTARNLYVCRSHWHRIRMMYGERISPWPTHFTAGEPARYAYDPPVAWGEPTAEEVRLWNDGFGQLATEQEIVNDNNETIATNAAPAPTNTLEAPWFRAYVDAIYENPYADIPRRNNVGRFLDAVALEHLRFHQRRARNGLPRPLRVTVDGDTQIVNDIPRAAVTAIPVFNIERNADGEIVMRDRDNPDAEAVTITNNPDLAMNEPTEEVVTIQLGNLLQRVANEVPGIGATPGRRPTHDYYGNPITPVQPYWRHNDTWIAWFGTARYYPVDRAIDHMGRDVFGALPLPAGFNLPGTPPPEGMIRPIIAWAP